MLERLVLDQVDFKEGSHWNRRSFRINEVIVREGAFSGKVFVVLSGRVRVIGKVSLDKHTVRPGFRELGQGEVFGELAMVDHGPHGASVVAMSEGELAEIKVTVLDSYLTAHPEIGSRFYKDLARILANRLRSTNEKMLSLLGWGLKAHGYEEYLK